MDADELILHDREAKQWLDDIESFRRPPPVKKLIDTDRPFAERDGQMASAVDSAQSPPARNGCDDFVAKLRKFQLSDSHPYSCSDRVEAYKKLATPGRVASATGMLRLAGLETKKETITKQQANALREEVTKLNRPVNPYSSPRSDSDPNASPCGSTVDRSESSQGLESGRGSSNDSSSAPYVATARRALKKNHLDNNGPSRKANINYNNNNIKSSPGQPLPQDNYQTALADREVSRIMGKANDAFFRAQLLNNACQSVNSNVDRANSASVERTLRLTDDGLVSDGFQRKNGQARSSAQPQANNYARKVDSAPVYGQVALWRQQMMYKDIERRAEMEIAEKTKVYGQCFGCQAEVTNVTDGVHALGNLYHPQCFVCCRCGRSMNNRTFYAFDGRVYCPEDYKFTGYQEAAEKCHTCGHMILEMILQAGGKSFHPKCFCCHECGICLDGVPFTLDSQGRFYCVRDYHKTFAPKCAKCLSPITPVLGADETVRVVAMDRDYHVDCYVCEACGMQLTDEPEKRCYPLGEHLLCKTCHYCWTRTGGMNNPITDV